jgi:isoquinoline 1-oxidoreductase alpha subunit
MANFSLKINGQNHQLDVDPTTPILGIAIRSCMTPVSQVGSQEITTIEGLGNNDKLHPLQEAWLEHDVAQCGYCQSGQIMNAASLLNSNENPSDEQIEAAMSGNICRCGTYTRIKQAIKTAASNS